MKKNYKNNIYITIPFFILGLFIGVSFFNATYGSNWYQEQNTNLSSPSTQTVLNETIDELLKTPTSISPEDIITSSDYNTETNYLGAIYEKEIDDEFKAVYALSNKLNSSIYVQNKHYDFLKEYICELIGDTTEKKCSDLTSLDFTISIATLNEITTSLFPSTQLVDSFDATNYRDISKLSCANNQCNVSIQLLPIEPSPTKYITDITPLSNANNLTFRVETFYITPNNQNDTQTISIYNARNGDILKEISAEDIQTITFDNIKNTYQIIPNIYIFTFNQKGQLESVHQE